MEPVHELYTSLLLHTKVPMGRHSPHSLYSRRQVRTIQQLYLAAAVLWILLCYILRTYKAPKAFGWIILAVPLILYALGYINANKISKKVEDHAASTNILTIAVVFVTVLLEVSHNKRKHHYSVYIMLTALVLLILSAADVWTGHKHVCVARHAKSIVRTAAITLLIFVIYINVIERVPLHECHTIPPVVPETTSNATQKSVLETLVTDDDINC